MMCFNFCSAQNNMQPQIFEEGIISTGDYETHPAFSPTGDTLYFLKCLSDAQFCSIAVSYKKNNSWSAPEIVSFSGKYVDADPFVTKDGNTMYFVSSRPLHEGEPVKQDWDIWKTERTSSGWKTPVPLDSPLNSSGNEFFPTMADNGDLYFGSDRTGGKGRADIYVSKFVDGKYLQPVNLGDSINTPDNEYEPFIAPDESYLILMITYPNGIAHADFYISFNRNGVWSKAQKLPEPINSYATEWGGKVTRDGKYFFFGSSRNKITDTLPQREDMQQYEKRLHSAGNGLGDIYYVEMSALKK
jgi:Tol biopolymer transport system component